MLTLTKCGISHTTTEDRKSGHTYIHLTSNYHAAMSIEKLNARYEFIEFDPTGSLAAI